VTVESPDYDESDPPVSDDGHPTEAWSLQREEWTAQRAEFHRWHHEREARFLRRMAARLKGEHK
jgi:hypothetical protein